MNSFKADAGKKIYDHSRDWCGSLCNIFYGFFFTIFDSIVKCMFYGQMNQHKKISTISKKGSKFTILASYVFFHQSIQLSGEKYKKN